jgi:hypothetical protein
VAPMVKITILWAFIKQIGIPMLLITLASLYARITNLTDFPVPIFFWFKLLVDAVIFFFWIQLRANEIYYYYNLGIRKRFLFTAATIADITVFVILHLIASIWL